METPEILKLNEAEIYSSGDRCEFSTQHQFVALFIRDLARGFKNGDYMDIAFKSEKHIDSTLQTLQRLSFNKIECTNKTYYYSREIKGAAIKLEFSGEHNLELRATRVNIEGMIKDLSVRYIEYNELLNDIDGLRKYDSYRKRVALLKLTNQPDDIECTAALNSLSCE